MRRLLCLLLCLLLLCGCAQLPDPADPAPQAPNSSQQSQIREPQSEEPSAGEEPALTVAETLALEAAREAGLLSLSGEAAVRQAYLWLLENVYFSDPVCLDAWRYLSEDADTLISYLDNRALSPLLFGIGSCEDFAAAMVLLLRAAGLEAEYVAGLTLSVEQEYIDHAWAVVELNGAWYHLDPQLEQNVTRQGRLTWRYYLKSDETFRRDHKWGENLIEFAGDLTGEQQTYIREEHTPPACPEGRDPPMERIIQLPPRPNMADVEQLMGRIRQESGRGQLDEIPLNVEPPVLVSRYHVTPLLQPEFAGVERR